MTRFESITLKRDITGDWQRIETSTKDRIGAFFAKGTTGLSPLGEYVTYGPKGRVSDGMTTDGEDEKIKGELCYQLVSGVALKAHVVLREGCRSSLSAAGMHVHTARLKII